MTKILKELKQAQIEKEYASVNRIFKLISKLIDEEADMSVQEFLSYRERVIEDARWHKCGPFRDKKTPLTNIEKNFQEDMINDMFSDESMNPYDHI